MRVAVIGLGKLGSPIAALYACAGHTVCGVDISAKAVEALNSGVAPVSEPQLQDFVSRGHTSLTATTDWETGLKEADVSIIIVPTPSQADGTFTNKYVVDAISRIGEQYRRAITAREHTIIVASTVMPGSMGGEIRSALENASGTHVGKGLGLVYSPQFIALGSVIRNLQYPDMVLIGQSHDRAGEVAEALLKTVVLSDAAFHRMALVNAEIVKLSVNTFVTTKISFANMLSEMCDALEGADVDVVTRAVGSDSRIGTKYLSGGLGYGGPCFPRDNIALAALGRQIGVDASIAIATDRVNDRQVERIVSRVASLGDKVKSVHVWGLSYKPDTDVTDASQGVQIAQTLKSRGYDVAVHDPQVPRTLADDLGVSWIDSPNTSSPDVIVICTPWPHFVATAQESSPKLAIIDPWGVVQTATHPIIRPGR
jgi:UDPglucose 6-dehydrogenase